MKPQVRQYPLPSPGGFVHLDLPRDYEILSVGLIHRQPVIWIKGLYPSEKLEPENNTEFLRIEGFLTGQSMPHDMGVSYEYIGTVTFPDGSSAYHYFQYTGVL